MIGLNGPLLALLFAAYFVLVVSALSYGHPTAEADRTMRRREAGASSEAPVLVAYTLTMMNREARCRRVDHTIDDIVMTVQRNERRGRDDRRRTVGCEPRRRAPNRPSSRTTASRDRTRPGQAAFRS